MMSYEEIAEMVFDYVSVWYDAPAESYFYQWAWEQIEDELATDNPAEARVYAATLAYIYAELCYFVCDENFHEDIWYKMDEFTDSDVAVSLGFLCGEANLDCPEDMDEAMRLLVRENHGRVAEALGRCGTITLLTAFHASYAKPKRMVVDEDGDEGEEDLIEDYESFCRYVDDAEYRSQDVGGMSVSRYEAASMWWENGAEMLEVETDSDEERYDEERNHETPENAMEVLPTSELDVKGIQARVGAVAELVKAYVDSGVGNFKILINCIVERHPDKFGSMKPYLHSVWNAVAEQMELKEITKKEAEAIYAETENVMQLNRSQVDRCSD